MFANYNAKLVLLRRLKITVFFTISKMKSDQKLRTQEVVVMVEKIFWEIQSSFDAKNQMLSLPMAMATAMASLPWA